MRTNDLLATGGMLQEGGTTDPVSGNDVPTGSLKAEVRDDVPAQLSPGEFVFPADVTRYIGLDKLMQIREAAKEGLKEMESKGQMGNAEEVDGDAVDTDTFSSNIDDIISGLDNEKGEPKQFAEGGVVDDPAYTDAPIKGFKMVQYEDPKTKAVRYIPFINGKPLLSIPTGYVLKQAAPTTVTPPGTTPADQASSSATSVSGGGNAGNKSTEAEGGGGVFTRDGDTGVEGFGDIGGGTSPNVARVIGAGLGFVNPVLGLIVSAAGQYATKENNKKVAADNVKAIDASALSAMGFSPQDIKQAQDAVAKATLEGKSAKDIAVAAANAASASNSSKTALDGLVAVTNGWNTAKKEDPITNMPQELVDKIPQEMWGEVTKSIQEGLTPEAAVQKAVDAVADPVVSSYFSADAKLADSGLEARIPAGEYDNVVADIKAGLTAAEAVDKAVQKATQERYAEQVAKEKADADAADKAARDQERADQEARDREAAAREAANQAALNAAREAADKAEKDAADKAARDAEAKATKEAADRAAQQAAQDAAEKAERDAQTAQDAAADKESQGGGGGGGGGNWGAGGNWGGNSLSRDTGGESGGAG